MMTSKITRVVLSVAAIAASTAGCNRKVEPARPTAELKFVRAFGQDEGPGKLLDPLGVTVSPTGEIFVTDAGHHRVYVFDEQGSYLRSFGGQGSDAGKLDRPMHLDIGADGLVYVAEYINDRVSVFGQDGDFVRHISLPGVDAPGGVALAKDGTVYVPDFYNHRVLLMVDGSSTPKTWGSPGRKKPGELHYPTDVALAADGALWVADAYNGRLQRFVDGRAGVVIDGFGVANAVEVDDRGWVWGVDFDGNNVQAFDSTGNSQLKFGTAGSDAGQFTHPTDIAVARNQVVIADFGNHRIQLFELVLQPSS